MNGYSDNFKSAMVKKLTSPGAMSASALSSEVGIPQSTLSRWVREFSYNGENGVIMRAKRPGNWAIIEKLNAIFEFEKLPVKEQGIFLRTKGLHQTHIDQWKQEIVGILKKQSKNGKKKSDLKDKKIKELERELNRKEKALAETAALLVLKKKAEKIWGGPEEEK